MRIMTNSVDNNLTTAIAEQLNLWLNYVDGYKLRLITNYFNIDPMTNDKYDYGCYMDAILYHCNDSLENSINILKFINNGYK